MHDDGPQRLKKRGAEPSVVRALEALRQGTDETARLERVAAKLGPLLDAPPRVAPDAPRGVRGLSSALLRRASFKLILGGLAVLVPAAWMMRGAQSGHPQVQAPASERTAIAKPAEAAVRDAGTTSPSSAVSAYAAGAHAHSPAYDMVAQGQDRDRRQERLDKERAVSPSKGVARTRRQSARQRSGGGVRESAAVTDRVQPTAEVAREPSTSAKQTEEAPQSASAKPADELALAPKAAEQGAGVEPSASSKHANGQEPAAVSGIQAAPRTPTPAATQRKHAETEQRLSESALLFEARKALGSDAEIALRLLDEHAQRFPKGALVPEREVLAIEALRALGRTAEADARLARFEAHYPHSLHLDRLRR